MVERIGQDTQSSSSGSPLSSRWSVLREVLGELNQAPGVQAAFLVSDEGLHVASVAPGIQPDPDELAGMVARLRHVAAGAQKQIQFAGGDGWIDIDEVTVESTSGHRLVTRSVEVGRQILLLVVLTRPKSRYRRATAQALRAIRQVWSRF